MTQFTKDFFKSAFIWTILFGILLVFGLSQYAESKVKEMVYSLNITPLYVCLTVSTIAGSVFTAFVTWFAIGRVLNGGCIDVPQNFNKWLRNYAIVVIVLAVLTTLWNIYDYSDKVDRLDSVFSLLAYQGSYAGTRMVKEIASFKDNYILIEGGLLGLCVVLTILSLPLIKRRYDSL